MNKPLLALLIPVGLLLGCGGEISPTGDDGSDDQLRRGRGMSSAPDLALPPLPALAVSLAVQGAPDLPLNGTTTLVTVGIVSGTPTRVELSRDGNPPFATWPSDSFFTLAADGKSLTGNWCISSACWGNLGGAHVLKVVATDASGATATASVALNVADASSPAAPLAPKVSRFAVVASDPEGSAPAGAPGNNWGGHQSRIARTTSGEVYAAYLAPPAAGVTDPSQAPWVLARRGPADSDGFTEVARRRCGREPMHLVRTPDDHLQILSWPGTPVIYDVTPGASPTVSGPTAIPGGWEMLSGSATPYSGAGVAPDGQLCFAASRGVAGTLPGAVYTADSAWDFACRLPTGAWTAHQSLPIGLRHAYPFVLPRTGGAWQIVAKRDVMWAAAGYTQPAGSFDYVFNVVTRWLFADPASTTPTREELGRLEPTPGGNVAYGEDDALVDHLGRLHVLVRSKASDGTRRMQHLLFDGAGGTVQADITVAGYTDGILRLVEDDQGRFVLFFFASQNVYAYPAVDADGLVQGAQVDLSSGFVSSTRSLAGWPYLATPRGGTPNGRFVDMLLDVTDAGVAEVAYARVQLY